MKPTKPVFTLSLLSIAITLVCPRVYADEGGTSFWLPGQYGSLAAVPAEPGWSLALIYFHASTDAGGSSRFTWAWSAISIISSPATVARERYWETLSQVLSVLACRLAISSRWERKIPT